VKYTKFEKIFFNLLFIIISALVIIPLLIVLSASISNEKSLLLNGYSILPRNIDFAAYKYILTNPKVILQGYNITLIVSLAATAWAMFIQTMFAYPLAKKEFAPKGVILKLLLITILFSGGLVPTYLLNTRYLHLQDTIWIYIIATCNNAWNIFLLKGCYKDVPESLLDAAKIDGASDFRILYTIVIPITKSVIVMLAFGMFMGMWNNWMTSMLYINNRTELYTIQYILQKSLSNLEFISSQGLSNANDYIPTETLKMAMAVIVAVPVLFIFPFFQKHLTHGVTMGSVKE